MQEFARIICEQADTIVLRDDMNTAIIVVPMNSQSRGKNQTEEIAHLDAAPLGPTR